MLHDGRQKDLAVLRDVQEHVKWVLTDCSIPVLTKSPEQPLALPHSLHSLQPSGAAAGCSSHVAMDHVAMDHDHYGKTTGTACKTHLHCQMLETPLAVLVNTAAGMQPVLHTRLL